MTKNGNAAGVVLRNPILIMECNMTKTEKFREQHNDLLKLATELQLLLDEKNLSLDAKTARSCLSKLMGKLTLHLSLEDNVLYPSLSKSKNIELSSLAARFSNEMKVTITKVTKYNEKWATPTSIKTNQAAFIAETKQIISVLADRIKRENQELYSLADRTPE